MLTVWMCARGSHVWIRHSPTKWKRLLLSFSIRWKVKLLKNSIKKLPDIYCIHNMYFDVIQASNCMFCVSFYTVNKNTDLILHLMTIEYTFLMKHPVFFIKIHRVEAGIATDLWHFKQISSYSYLRAIGCTNWHLAERKWYIFTSMLLRTCSE